MKTTILTFFAMTLLTCCSKDKEIKQLQNNLKLIKVDFSIKTAFINFEKDDIKLIGVDSTDELGMMSKIINKNMSSLVKL